MYLQYKAVSSPGKQCTSCPESFLSYKIKRQNSVKETWEEKRASTRNKLIIVPPQTFPVLCHAVFYLRRKIKNRKGGGVGGINEKEKSKPLLFSQLSQIHWHCIKLKNHCWQKLYSCGWLIFSRTLFQEFILK